MLLVERAHQATIEANHGHSIDLIPIAANFRHDRPCIQIGVRFDQYECFLLDIGQVHRLLGGLVPELFDLVFSTVQHDSVANEQALLGQSFVPDALQVHLAL